MKTADWPSSKFLLGPGSSSSDGDGSTMQDAGQGGGFVYTKLSNPQRKQKKRRQPRSGAVELTKAELLERRIEIVESKKQWLRDEATRVGRSIRGVSQARTTAGTRKRHLISDVCPQHFCKKLFRAQSKGSRRTTMTHLPATPSTLQRARLRPPRYSVSVSEASRILDLRSCS